MKLKDTEQLKLKYIQYNTGDYSWTPYVFHPNSLYDEWMMIVMNNFEVIHPSNATKLGLKNSLKIKWNPCTVPTINSSRFRRRR